MAAYSEDVDSALIAKLLADATLMALMVDGVYYDIASSGATQFVIVKLMAHTVEHMFDGRAFESPVYLVKAVVKGNDSVTVKAAAKRINVLFDGTDGKGSTLTVAGYGGAHTAFEEYVRYTETDPANADLRWQHRGGLYSVFVSTA